MTRDSFIREVDRTIEVYERLIGQHASRTRNMIDEYGYVDALSRLVISPELQKGFKVLRDKGQLHESFEALVGRFEKLFSRDVVEAAKWRLENAESLI